MTGSTSRRGCGPRRAEAPARLGRRPRDRAARRGGMSARRVSRPSADAASRAPPPAPAPSSGCAGRSASRSSVAIPAQRSHEFEANRERVERRLGATVRPAVSPHAPYTVSGDSTPPAAGSACPIATHLHESTAEGAGCSTGPGRGGEYAHLLGAPLGTTAIRMLAERGLLERPLDGRALRPRRRGGDRPARPARGRRRPLPALERVPRLRDRAGPGDARRRRQARPRDGQPGLDAVVRHVRGDAGGRRGGPRARAPFRCPQRRGGAGARHARLCAGDRARRGDRYAGAREERRPRGRLAGGLTLFPGGGPSRSSRVRRVARSRTLETRRRGSSLREGSDGLARADRRRVAARGRACSRRPRNRCAPRASAGRHDLLPSPPRIRRSGCSSCSPSSSAAASFLRRRHRLRWAQRHPRPASAQPAAAVRATRSRDEKEGSPEQSAGAPRSRDALENNGKSTRRSNRSRSTSRLRPRTSTRTGISPGSTSARRTRSARRRSRRRSRPGGRPGFDLPTVVVVEDRAGARNRSDHRGALDEAQQGAQAAFTKMSTAYAKAVVAYKAVVKAQPRDPPVLLELAQTRGARRTSCRPRSTPTRRS